MIFVWLQTWIIKGKCRVDVCRSTCTMHIYYKYASRATECQIPICFVVSTVYPFVVCKMRFAALFLSLAIVVCSTKFCIANVELKVQFVNDFIANENPSLATVVRASCWSRVDMVRFVSKSRTSVQFIESTALFPEFPVIDLANQMIFFVDMSCSDSTQFLFQVCYVRFTPFKSLCCLCFLLKLIFIFAWLFDHDENVDKTNESYYRFPYHWILFNVSLISHRSSLNALRLLPDSDVTIVHYNETSNDYRLQQGSCQQPIYFSFLRVFVILLSVRSLQNPFENGNRHFRTVWQMGQRHWIIGSAIDTHSLTATTRFDGTNNLGVNGSDQQRLDESFARLSVRSPAKGSTDQKPTNIQIYFSTDIERSIHHPKLLTKYHGIWSIRWMARPMFPSKAPGAITIQRQRLTMEWPGTWYAAKSILRVSPVLLVANVECGT